jgi:hypothetical protein
MTKPPVEHVETFVVQHKKIDIAELERAFAGQ